MRVRGTIAVPSALAVLVAGLALPAAAAPAPTQPPAPVAAAAITPAAAPGLNVARFVIGERFGSQMAGAGLRVTWSGRVTGTGSVRDVRVGRQFDEVFLLGATVTLRGPRGSMTCRQVGVDAVQGYVRCIRPNGTVMPLWRVVGGVNTALPDLRYVQRGTLRVASPWAAQYLQRVLGTDLFSRQPVIGSFSVLRQLPSKASGKDARAGCERDSYARDTLVNRGWAVQQIVNNLPQNLTVSQWVKEQGKTTYKLITPQAPQTNLGQRTPLKEGGRTTDHKAITSGSKFDTDYFYEDYSYDCHTMAPYVVSPGPIDPAKDATPWYTEEATAWNYDGVVRTRGNSAGARPTWFAHPRQSDRDSPIGTYSWTCRGTPSGTSKTETWWRLVSQGTGFYGDNGEQDNGAGSAPDCQDKNLAGSNVVTKYAVSKLGYMKGRGESGWPRGCSVDAGAVIGCGQEVYSLEYLDGFRRAWAFQNHIFASALRAQISSTLSVQVPAAYDPEGIGYEKAVAWRIYGATISGAWPNFTDDEGTDWNLSGASVKKSAIDWSKPSAYTVPGTNTPFTLSGYGAPREGTQTLTFKLVADVDGNGGWTSSQNPVVKAAAKAWPTVVSGPNAGLELPRPEVTVTLRYDLNNFNDNGSCASEMSTWWEGWNGVTDTSGIHCLEGVIPTIWPLSVNGANNEKRVIDQFVPDKIDPNKKVENQATAKMTYSVADDCFIKTEVKVSNFNEDDVKTAPVLGADYTWVVKLTGTVSTYSSCPS